MKKAYEKLYEDCIASESFFDDAHFVSMSGEYYQDNTRKFLLIGRATNGWGAMDTLTKESFANEAEAQFNNHDRWNWIESINGVLYSTHDRYEKNLAKRYCIDKKPYWTYTREIWKQLSGTIHENDIWQKNIAWSNLYKVSPKQSDNPDWNSQQIQQKSCIEILKRELELYTPSHIPIISGFDWFEPFAELFTDVCDTGKRNILRGPKKNDVFVEGTAMYKNAKVVIACRPEWRDCEGYVDAISKAFNTKQ